MATIGKGEELRLPQAEPGEPVDILSFVVTKAGWATLKDRIGISSSNPIRILTRLIYQSVINPIEQAGGDWNWRGLPTNHAKVILYRKQKVAVLGSFNLTGPSLGDNIECLASADHDYSRLAAVFEKYWTTAKKDDAVIVTPQTLIQALAATIDPTEEDTPGEAATNRQGEFTNGRRTPWPYQEKIIEQVMAWLASGRDVDLGRIVKLPTGAGKTLVAGEIIRKLLEKKPRARILWVCHRVELLRQSWKSTQDQISGVIPESAWFVPQHIKDESSARDRKEFRYSQDCQMAFCTQGMLPHLLKWNRQKQFDLTVVDECHRFHPQSTVYRTLYRYCERKHIPRLGLTATPLDHDKRRFGKYWDIQSMFGTDQTQELLVRERFLSKIHRTLTTRRETNFTFDFRKDHAGREHHESELATRIKEFNNDNVNREVASAWKDYRGKRQRVLCFAVTIDHVKTLMRDYFEKDTSVKMVHSDQTTEENRMNLAWFKDPNAPESRMLVSVLMLAEGIDLPKTDCLFMVRPTFSPELHQQMIGRGLRGPKVGGTEDYAVVDFTSQYVDRNGEVLRFTQVIANIDGDVTAGVDRGEAEEDEEPVDLDASGKIKTVKDLRIVVDDLRDKKAMTIRDACDELAQELDYSAHTLVNYYHTKANDYPLGWEDPEDEPSEQLDDGNATEEATLSDGYITRNKLMDLRVQDPQKFEEIASLTKVTSSTLRSYCSRQENFRRWKTNNKDTLDQVRVILTESLAKNSAAA